MPVRDIIIDGLALILNGAVRFTQDGDLWLEPTNENRDRFINSLLAFGYDEEMVQSMREADFTQPKMVRIHDIPMDVLTSVHSSIRVHYLPKTSQVSCF